MIFILHQQERIPIWIWSKNNACGAYSYISFACSAFFSHKNPAFGAFFFTKNLVRGAFDFSFLFGLPISLELKMI